MKKRERDRKITTVTFQPTSANEKILQLLRVQRGAQSEYVNRALTHYAQHKSSELAISGTHFNFEL